MLEDLLPYYERELSSLRALAGEFAQRYPKVARRLQLDQDHCEDPHVERLLEGFAFLAARIHRKLDDEYPEITEAFMQVLYPHYLRPMPSATILQLIPDPQGTTLAGGYRVPRHSVVNAPRIQGVQCQFRTTHDVDLWPLRVRRARLELTQTSDYLTRLTDAAAVLTLEVKTLGGLPMASLPLERLRFFLDGEPPLIHLLYELLAFRLQGVRCSDGMDNGRALVLPGTCVRPAGFAPGEELYEADGRSFPGFRLLAEYFAFPEKFMFFDLEGLDRWEREGPGEHLRLQFLVSPYGATERHLRLIRSLSAAHFKLGCVPIVNLFKQSGTPIRVDHHQLTYPVTALNPGAFEVYAIDRVTRIHDGPATDHVVEVPPLYAIRHGCATGDTRFHWYSTRDPGGGVALALVDLDFKPTRPDSEVLSLQLTCSNRNLPEALPFGGDGRFRERFELTGHEVVKLARVLRKPTPNLQPPSKRGLQWRLISHLSLNHLSLVAGGPEALQETLELYNFTGSPAAAQQIRGIKASATRPATARLKDQGFASFVRGVEVQLTFDESCYVGSNLYLFASVLERFLAYSCPPNSFITLSLATLQHPGELARWPPRAGDTALI